MPADIRSFFGGGGGAPKTGSTPAKKDDQVQSSVMKKRGRKIIDDSDDEEEVKPKSKKVDSPRSKARPKEEPKEELTTSSEYFAASSKTKQSRSTPIRPKATMSTAKTNGSTTTTPTKSKDRTAATPTSSTRKSSRKTAAKKYTLSDDDEIDGLLQDDNGGTDDILASGFGKLGRDEDEYAEDDHDEDDLVVQKPRSSKHEKAVQKSSTKTKNGDVDMLNTGTKASAPSSKARPGKKRKSAELEDEESDDAPVQKKTSKKATRKSPAKKAKAAQEEKQEDPMLQAIFDSIPTIRAPTPPPRDENKKFNFAAQNNRNAPPPGAGTKEIPTGAENCLAGLSFVFTGVLDTLGRDEGQALVKRYGGKVSGAPSKNTSYVVLGNEAGPKKLETIQQLNLKTINEDGLFALIEKLPAHGGEGKHTEKYAEKKAKEEAKVREEAAELDRQERKLAQGKAKVAARHNGTTPTATPSSQPSVDTRLWTDKYAPASTSSVCGNKGQVEKLQRWLRNWHYNAKFNFKKAGADGTGIYRAAMLHGPPGIGKTTAAHLVANLEGYDVVESNASDTRSKKLVETGLKGVLDTTSLLGYFAGDGKKVESSRKKLCMIMDEVDGMSAGDRGGVGAMAAIAKKTNIPLILICNERRLPKMKPFDHITADFQFRRPTTEQIRTRLMTICFREKIKMPAQVLDALIEGSHADIRQIINMISTAKLDKSTMDFDEGKAMSKAWEKHVILKPWDIVSKIVRPELWSPASKTTLNDKIELYFNDHEFSYLMLQENYLKSNPVRANAYSGAEKKYKLLEIYDNAAQSISDGDLVDRMIHGSQQQWSLMPTHAVFSFVRPASFAHGMFTTQPNFPSWLGQNSKWGRLSRFVKEIQGHMRLRASGDRHEIRQQYLPALWNKTVKRLVDDGKDSVDDIIDIMDSYYLTKEDYDAMVELGLGDMAEDNVKIEPSTKAAFTRLYNQRSHPVPFMKAGSVGAPKAAPKIQPDLEDAIEESDEDLAVEDEGDGDEDEEIDFKKDKYIQAPKKKKAAGGGKGKGKKGADENENGHDNDVKKPAKGKGSRKSKGKA